MLVSVIIPTFNGASYVGEALASACAQTLKEFEILVLDDGSSDNTLEIVAQCGDPRLCVVRNLSTLGLAGNWNRGVELSQGEYVLILHQDDRLAPQMLETQVSRLRREPEAGYAYSAYRLIDPAGQVLQVVRPFPGDHVWQGEKEFEHHLRKNYVQCPTVVVRRACYEALGGYSSRLKYALDWEMWLRIESHGYRVAYSAQPLSDWRLHGESATWLIAKEQNVHINDEMAALDLTFENIPPEQGALRLLRRRAYFELIKQCMLRAKDTAQHKDWKAVRRHLNAARLAYARGGDFGFFPFFVTDLARFLGRRMRSA
jgi:glycosyltransferase involved in cell wall biosynthesis